MQALLISLASYQASLKESAILAVLPTLPYLTCIALSFYLTILHLLADLFFKFLLDS